MHHLIVIVLIVDYIHTMTHYWSDDASWEGNVNDQVKRRAS